jgi:hypothetical protein
MVIAVMSLPMPRGSGALRMASLAVNVSPTGFADDQNLIDGADLRIPARQQIGILDQDFLEHRERLRMAAGRYGDGRHIVVLSQICPVLVSCFDRQSRQPYLVARC